ncbi:MAG: FAD-binding protein, partial [Rhizobiaceae bacterium]
MGASLQGRLLKIGVDNDLDIRPDTPFEHFIVEDGRVVGAAVRHDGRTIRIRAERGVVANAGGFAHNGAMRAQFGRPGASATTQANPGETGEVLTEAIKLGAAVDCMDEAIWVPTSLGPDGVLPPGVDGTGESIAHFSHHWDVSFPHSIVVDATGRRFFNEASSYMEFGQRIYQRHQENGGDVPAWAIIESRHRKRYLWARNPGATPKEWLDSGYMIQAGSIAELAEKTGLPAENLRETITRFNGFAARGVDEDFHRGDAAFDQLHGDPTVKPNP